MATKLAGKKTKSGNQAPVIVALAAAVAGYFFWRWQQSKGPQKKGGGSKFRFPGNGKASNDASSSLPRNKASNNKKNKDRKREEKERRAEKRDKQAPKLADKEQPPASAVFNYSYFDSAPKAGISAKPPGQKKPPVLDSQGKEQP